MPSSSLIHALTLSVADASVPDGELLARFSRTGDGAAFELLVRRHAEMVWRVCRSELPRDRHSAEDAFQTAFVVLARKAGSVRGPALAGYLFRVARHAALRVRKRVGTVADFTADISIEPAQPDGDSAAVVEEVEWLPDKFRLPVLLCYFEDCTHAEAADRLGWAVGTVASRLARAKDRLRIRLTHRGLALPAVLAGVGVPTMAVRAAAAMATTPLAVPAGISELSREVMMAMANTNTKWLAGAALAAVLLTGGLGLMVLTAGPGTENPKPAAKPSSKESEKTDDAELKKLQGVWKVTKIENNLGVAKAKVIEPMRWEIVGSTVTAIDGPGEKQRSKSRIALDGSKSPKRIAMTALTQPGDKPGRKIEGIYEVKGDILRICFGEEGKEFPTEFKVAKGADMGLIELERVPKPAEKETPESAELKKLQGVWRVTKIETERGLTPAEVIESMRWEFTGSEVTAFDGPSRKLQVALDVTKSPKRMTMTRPARARTELDGPGSEPTVASIYELKGDTLRVYLAGPSKPLPTEFKAEKNSNGAVIELERIPDGIRDLKDLAGEWKVTADEPDDSGTVDIYRDVMWMTHGDKTEKAIIALDVEKGFLDITAITGPIAVRSKPMLGRFTWKDDKLTMYTGGLGAERPAEAKAGKGVTVAVMERVKKK